MANASQPNSPTIIEIGAKKGEEILNRFYIKGLTPANTNVLVYINGTYVKNADISSEKTDSDSFYYENSEILTGDNCWVMLIAQDKNSLVLSPPAETKYFFPSLPAPTLVGPSKENVLGGPKPKITGLSASQSFVHIYIDGVYNGHTELLSHESGTANFAYTPFLNLKPGPHEFQAVAEDRAGRKSKISEVLEFKIEERMPAPTLFEPVILEDDSSQPFIVGLAKNSSFVKIYIDHKLIEKFLVKNHESSTANFAYKPAQPLVRGNHLIYATAVDSRGKESQWSNIVYFLARQPIIADSAEEENIEVVVENKEENLVEKNDAPAVASPSGDVQKEIINSENDNGKIDEQQTVAETVNSGAINESKQKQNRLSPNLVVFIIFLLGIIGWILWVNRELAKERREQEETLRPFSQVQGGQASLNQVQDRQGRDKKDDDLQIKKD